MARLQHHICSFPTDPHVEILCYFGMGSVATVNPHRLHRCASSPSCASQLHLPVCMGKLSALCSSPQWTTWPANHHQLAYRLPRHVDSSAWPSQRCPYATCSNTCVKCQSNTSRQGQPELQHACESKAPKHASTNVEQICNSIVSTRNICLLLSAK